MTGDLRERFQQVCDSSDSRLMGLVLAPMLVVEDLRDRDFSGFDGPVFPGPVTYLVASLVWAVLAVVARIQRIGNQFGVATLSWERELAADRGPPDEDLRAWKQSASVLDILPAEDAPTAGNPFRTHPPTDERVRRLRRLAAEMEG